MMLLRAHRHPSGSDYEVDCMKAELIEIAETMKYGKIERLKEFSKI